MLDVLADILLFISAIGALMTIELTKIPNADFTSPSIIMAVNLAGFLVLQLHKYRTTPKTVRDEGKRAESAFIQRGQILDQNILWAVFVTGIVAEFMSFVQLEHRIVAVGIYLTLSSALFLFFRKRVGASKWVFMFHFGIALVVPVVTFTWIFPEVLYETGLFNVYGSREYSYLIFLYLQAGLFLSTLITASYSWRTGTLIKLKLGIKELIRVQRDFLASIKDENLRDDLREIVSDTATLRETILNGQFETTCGWGWSIMDRLLGKISSGRNLKDKARNVNLLTERFVKCYQIRNKTVHGGHKPNFDEAIRVLELIRETLIELTSRNQQSKKDKIKS